LRRSSRRSEPARHPRHASRAEVATIPCCADRFIERWQKLDRERIRYDRSGDWQSEYRIRDSMGEMAKVWSAIRRWDRS
jgi:hypothetical protein